MKGTPFFYRVTLCQICLLLGISTAAIAQPSLNMSTEPGREKTDLEKALERDGMVNTKEQTVMINGIEYRQVEYEGTRYYLKATAKTGEFTLLDCHLSGTGKNTPHLIEMGIKVFKRTRLFVSALQQSCTERGGQVKTTVDISPMIGVALPNNPKDKIQNKKIGVNPFAGALGFGGEW